MPAVLCRAAFCPTEGSHNGADPGGVNAARSPSLRDPERELRPSICAPRPGGRGAVGGQGLCDAHGLDAHRAMSAKDTASQGWRSFPVD